MRTEVPFSQTMFAEFDTEEDGHCLAVASMVYEGYRQVSNRFCRVARVDISEDELIRFLRKHLHWEDDGLYHANPGSWQDHYRRCYSRDVIIDVPENVMRALRYWIDYRLPCFK